MPEIFVESELSTGDNIYITGRKISAVIKIYWSLTLKFGY